MARNYKRDSKGRFSAISGAVRKARLKKVQSKHKRIDGYFKSGEYDSIKGTPMHRKLVQRQAARQRKIARLKAR